MSSWLHTLNQVLHRVFYLTDLIPYVTVCLIKFSSSGKRLFAKSPPHKYHQCVLNKALKLDLVQVISDLVSYHQPLLARYNMGAGYSKVSL